jgi:hypothetical protein
MIDAKYAGSKSTILTTKKSKPPIIAMGKYSNTRKHRFMGFSPKTIFGKKNAVIRLSGVKAHISEEYFSLSAWDDSQILAISNKYIGVFFLEKKA